MYAKRDIYAWKEEARTEFSQTASIKIKCKRNDIWMHVIYRSPNSSKQNDENLYKWLNEMRGNYIIVGDFNFPDIRWATGSAGSKGKKFYEIITDRLMEQHVEEETHSKGNILDLILSNKEDLVSDVRMEGKVGGSAGGLKLTEEHHKRLNTFTALTLDACL